MIPETLNPRLLALYGNEMPKHHVREWMRSYHVRREMKKAMGEDSANVLIEICTHKLSVRRRP